MEKINFTVKDESVEFFIKKYLTKYEENKDFYNNNLGSKHIFTDELIIKKGLEIKEGFIVIIELKDTTVNSQKSLLTTYFYKVYLHDDISLKLDLENFKINLL